MARALPLTITKRDDDTKELIRAVHMRLGRVGGRVEEGSKGNLIVVFDETRKPDEIRDLVRKQLDECADDWQERIEL